MKLYFKLILLAFAISFSTPTWAQIFPEDEADYREWCKVISSDEFAGRKPMTPFEDKTIHYLADEFRKLGLQPAYGDSYFQEVKEISTFSRPLKNKITVKGAKGKTELNFPDDIMIWTVRGTDKVVIPQTDYVFCGFGIDAPEYQWNDFEGVDVKGKIVIAMVNDPGFYNEKLFRGKNMTYYGRWIYKLEQAEKLGAAGCLVLHNTAAASYGWDVCCASHLQSNLGLCDETMNANALGFKGWLHENGCRKLFKAAGLDFEATLEAAKKPGFKPIALKAKSNVTMNVTYEVKPTHNVVAVLPGTDLKDECIVFNAHWDHFGIGKPVNGDSIYNGAADNASGIAGIMLIAKRFQKLPIKPRRSLVFISPTSEESGLFGSQYYCEHPLFPMSKTATCINFDCIAPAELTKDVIILGGGESNLDEMVMSAAAAQGRIVNFDNDNTDGWFYRSDHYNFVKKGVPCLVIKNGDHPVNPDGPRVKAMKEWYHQPCDEYEENWDVSGSLSLVNVMYSVAVQIANSDEMPKWKPTSANHR